MRSTEGTLVINRLYSGFDFARRTIRLVRDIGFVSGIDALRVFPVVKPYTMVGRRRLEGLYRLVRDIERQGIPGDIVECGTCNGGTAAVLGAAGIKSNSTRRLWLFDSFAGLPEPAVVDGPRAASYTGSLVGSIERVEEALGHVYVPRHRVEIVCGWFQDTFPGVEIPQIAFLHIDADWYESVHLALKRFYGFIHPGGYIVFDDYGFWEGCRKAVDEFLAAMPSPPELRRIDSRGVYFQKPGPTGAAKRLKTMNRRFLTWKHFLVPTC